MHVNKKVKLIEYVQKIDEKSQLFSLPVIVGRFDRWNQLSRQTVVRRCLNIYLDELRGGAFLCENLVTETVVLRRWVGGESYKIT